MKGKLKTTPFDAAEHLKTPREMAVFLSEALETGDTALIAAAVGVVARANEGDRGADRAFAGKPL